MSDPTNSHMKHNMQIVRRLTVISNTTFLASSTPTSELSAMLENVAPLAANLTETMFSTGNQWDLCYQID